MKRSLLVFLIAAALLLSACGLSSGVEAHPLSLWYAQDDPLAPAMEALLTEYNASRERGARAVAARAFEDEAALTRALESGSVPDLLLCPHALAFSLDERRLLRAAGTGPDYPVWLLQRSDCVGKSYFPIGFELELLCADAPETPEALLERAAAYGRETGRPLLCVERFAPLFYQVLLDRGLEFSADPNRDGFVQDYVNFYNTLALACFDGGLSLETELSLPCRIERSSRLLTRESGGRGFYPLSEGPLLAEGRGLAVTGREPGTQQDLACFLGWLLSPERLSEAALSAGLVPAAEPASNPSGALEAALCALYGRELHLPDAQSNYYVNQSAFELFFRDALELLH